MRDDICTIPVSEVFEKNDGCPICRMRDTIEERLLDYILGDAMMEPDVLIRNSECGIKQRENRGFYRRNIKIFCRVGRPRPTE